MRMFRRLMITVFAAWLVLARTSDAQELVPRRWSHLPSGMNFAGAGVAYTTGDILFDPVMSIEDATVELGSYAASYIRSFELLGKSARVDLSGAYMTGRWEGLLEGEPASTSRAGWGDPTVRLAVSLYGAPPMRGQAFAAYRAEQDTETIVGAALAVTLPLGEYYEDRLINLGANRFLIRPQLGVVHKTGHWTGELTGSVWVWTDNDEYWNGNELEQYPMLAGQGHLIYTWHPGLWASASGAYGLGGEAKINGERKENRTENLMYALSAGVPITRQLGFKLSWIGARTQYRLGSNTDTFLASASYLW